MRGCRHQQIVMECSCFSRGAALHRYNSAVAVHAEGTAINASNSHRLNEVYALYHFA